MLNIKTKNKKPIGLTAFASPLAKPSERKEVLVVGVFLHGKTYHVLRRNTNAGLRGNYVRANML